MIDVFMYIPITFVTWILHTYPSAGDFSPTGAHLRTAQDSPAVVFQVDSLAG